MNNEYRTRKIERRLPHGVIQHTFVTEKIPPRYTFESVFGKSEIAKKVRGEPVTFMSDGVEYTKSVDSMLHTLSYSNDIKQRGIAADGINRVKAMIVEIRTENERKERMEMEGTTYTKHDTFAEYINDLQTVHEVIAAKQEALRKGMNDAKRKADSVPANGSAEYHDAQSALLRAKESYQDGLASLRKEAEEAIKLVREAFEEHLNAFYSPAGSSFNDGDILLLQSGMKLTQKEIESMLERNKGNATMIRMIEDYCGKAGIDSERVRVLSTYAKSNGFKEREAFDSLAQLPLYACGYKNGTNRLDASRAEVWSNPKSYARLYNQGAEALNGLKFRPELMETEPLNL